MFEPGQRVRCVNAFGWTDGENPSITGPRLDGVYTVASEFEAPCPRTGAPQAYVCLQEFPGRPLYVWGFEAALFRPIEDAELERLAALALRPPLRVRDLVDALELAELGA